MRTDTKESLRTLKVSSTWFNWAGGLIPSCAAPDLPCSPQSWGWYALLSSGDTLGLALLWLHHQLSVMDAEELSHDIKRRGKRMLGIHWKICCYRATLTSAQSEGQGIRAGLETGTACLAPSHPSEQWWHFQADCSKQWSRQRRGARVLLPLACHISAPSHSHTILFEEAGFAATGLAAHQAANSMPMHGALPMNSCCQYRL